MSPRRNLLAGGMYCHPMAMISVQKRGDNLMISASQAIVHGETRQVLTTTLLFLSICDSQ
jgi:hypothetical protein